MLALPRWRASAIWSIARLSCRRIIVSLCRVVIVVSSPNVDRFPWLWAVHRAWSLRSSQAAVDPSDETKQADGRTERNERTDDGKDGPYTTPPFAS